MGSASMHGCIILCTQIACAWWMCVTCICVSRTKHANDTVTLMESICMQALWGPVDGVRLNNFYGRTRLGLEAGSTEEARFAIATEWCL